MSSNAQRLAEAVLRRREELDLSQIDVWQSGGPSNTTLTAIENGLVENLTRTTARKLDKGLQWEEGSAKAVWNGGDPMPLGGGVLAGEDWRDYVDSLNLSPETREHVIATIEADLATQKRAAKGSETA